MASQQMNHRVSRLALGSAQFGLNYGVSNLQGKVPPEEVHRILSRAYERGIHTIDTAKAYGESERAIGLAKKSMDRPFRLVSKIPGLEERAVQDVAGSIRKEVEDSLERLHCQKLQGLLLHRESDLMGPRGELIWSALEALRAEGLVEKIGVSSHSPELFLGVLKRYPLTIAQIPCNVLDRRYLSENHRNQYAAMATELHARSVFLQGFFFFLPDRLPPFLSFAQEECAAVWKEAKSLGISAAALSLNFVVELKEISKVVFAVTSVAELEEVLSWPSLQIPETISENLSRIAEKSKGRLQDPLLWGMPPRP